MGGSNLFLNLAPINKISGAEGSNVGLVLKKATSSKGSFAVVRRPAAAAASSRAAVPPSTGGSRALRLSKATTIKFGSVSSVKPQTTARATGSPVVSILKKKQSVSSAATTDSSVSQNKAAASKKINTDTTSKKSNKSFSKNKIFRNKESGNSSNKDISKAAASNNNDSSSNNSNNKDDIPSKRFNKPSNNSSDDSSAKHFTTSSSSVGPVSRPASGSNSNGFTDVSRPAGAGTGSHVVSLFTGNPIIPTLKATDIDPVTEAVFSQDDFASLDISPTLTTHCSKLGYTSLTVVQQRGIPPILQGRDVLIKSQTGSGKTLTYALPIINSLLTMTPSVERSHGVLALIVVPTRELALQTFNWVQDLCKACIKIVPGYLMGGENKSSEKKRLRRGVNILVSTPGRLMDHIDTTERLALRNVRFLVLDEADRMLEMGYERSIASIIEALTEAKKFGDEKRFESKRNRENDNVNRLALGNMRQRMLPSNDDASDDSGVDSPSSKKRKNDDGTATSTQNSNCEETDSEDEVANEDIDDEEDEKKESASGCQAVISLEPRGTKIVSTNNGKPAAVRHQTILLSATLSQQVQRLAGVSLQDPVIVSVSGDAVDDVWGSESVITPENLVQHYTIVPAKLRLVTLASFILGKCLYGSNRKLLVFMATQDMVDYHTDLFQRVLARYGQVEKKVEQKSALETEADQLLDRINAKSQKKKQKNGTTDQQQQIEPLIQFMQLRGNMAQADRTVMFNRFRDAKSGVLLCTDVASRGLDLPSVAWIVQYTAAGSVTDYVHRVGRTSRADTRGDALLMLAPSEAGYIEQLHQHKIKLGEIKANNILTSFTLRPPLMDPMFQLPRSMEEGATKFQLRCEQTLLSCHRLHDSAKKAYISFVRAYASYPLAVRDVFSFKELHLGHYAKSYGLREAPTALGAAVAYKTQAVIRMKKERRDRRDKIKLKGVIAQRGGAVPRMASMSEFDSGLDGLSDQLSKQKKDQSKRHNHIAAKNRGDNNNKFRTNKSKSAKKPAKVISSKANKTNRPNTK